VGGLGGGELFKAEFGVFGAESRTDWTHPTKTRPGRPLAPARTDPSPTQVAIWVLRIITKATKGQGSAIRRPLGRLPEVFDFGIFAPPNFARGAPWSQKGPRMGNKIVFGAKKKRAHADG
jgi:hypothetical protein